MFGRRRTIMIFGVLGATAWAGIGTGSGSSLEAEAQQIVRRFLAPDADPAALTAALRPSAEDIRAVYGEPLASRLAAASEALFRAGGAVGPKLGHDDVVIVLTTTARLKAEGPGGSGFPGGYARVGAAIIADVPIARFTFVKKGETRGMAFDGLIRVNGRWVLIPKPWRALEE
jgi:plasmid stability protein